MTGLSGPPTYPPYVPPPYGGPARSSSTATVVTALLAALFVVATAVAAWAVHDHGTSSAAGAAPAPGASGPRQPGGEGGTPAGGGVSYATPSTVPVPTPTLSTSAYVPPPPTPTHEPVNGELVNRTFEVYMDGLINRSLSQVKSATCPKLRHTETGTALDGKYISRWKGHDYRIYDSLDYVILAATVRYVNPNTGGDGGTHVYSWYVDRYPDGHYWVCGILN